MKRSAFRDQTRQAKSPAPETNLPKKELATENQAA
jgi:hypothetical protein